MIVLVSDTHGRGGHRLESRTLEAVRAADLVLHCGDFMTESVLDAFEAEADRFAGVFGNNDSREIRERLPETRTVELEGVRIAMAHGHEHTRTALAMLGRQENADLVVTGHSHRPNYRLEGEVPVCNPGSHADPRWHRPGHAEIELDPLRGRIVEPDGTLITEFEVE